MVALSYTKNALFSGIPFIESYQYRRCNILFQKSFMVGQDGVALVHNMSEGVEAVLQNTIQVSQVIRP